MYSEKLEKLIEHMLADGVLTEKEKQVLMKAAEAEGIDLDEFEVVLEARLYDKTQSQVKNQVVDKRGQSDNLTGGFKQKLLDSISSNPALWKIMLVVVILGIVVLKMILSWIVTIVICLGIFAVLIYAIRTKSKIFPSHKEEDD
jgi:hypothetical protein